MTRLRPKVHHPPCARDSQRPFTRHLRTIADLVRALDRRMPGFRDKQEDGGFNFAVNDEVVLYHARDCALADGDVVELVPALSGG